MIKLEPDMLNKEVPLGEFAVTADDIRDFAEAVGDLNPLYLDAEAARQEGYPTVIAPPTFCACRLWPSPWWKVKPARTSSFPPWRPSCVGPRPHRSGCGVRSKRTSV